MATAITVKSESADYYTKVFDNDCTVEDVEFFLKHNLAEDTLYLVGFDSTEGEITEYDVIRILDRMGD